MLKKFDFKNTDTRVRRYIVPQRIVLTRGEVENAECLLTYRDRQIQLQERELMTMRKDSAILLDFGCEFHGGAEISVYRVKGAEAATLRLCFGESAMEALSHLGEKGACNDHIARDFTVDVKSYSTNEYTMTGYRFLLIELLTDCVVTVKTVQGVFVYQPYEYDGSFRCSDDRLNEIYDVSAYTCHLCMQNQLWDGIKRDRLVWIGDMSPELKTIKYVWGEKPEIYNGLRLAAVDAELPRWANTMATYSLWWLINLEEWCFHNNNYTYLEEQKDYTLGLIRQVLENIDNTGRFTAGTFIDWPTKDKKASAEATRALVILCMNAAEKMSRYFGEEALAEECVQARARAAAGTADCGGFKQLAALMQLTGIADENGVQVLQTGGAKGFSTFMSYYILTAMAQVCTTEETLTALRDYYGAMLDLGATTFWEDFDIAWAENACRLDEVCPEGKSDIHGDNGNYCYVGYRHSLCHGWSSGPVPFLTEHVLGVNITGAGCSKIEITPHLGNLAWAEGSIATPKGKVTIAHKKLADGTVETKVDAPAGVEIVLA